MHLPEEAPLHHHAAVSNVKTLGELRHLPPRLMMVIKLKRRNRATSVQCSMICNTNQTNLMSHDSAKLQRQSKVDGAKKETLKYIKHKT